MTPKFCRDCGQPLAPGAAFCGGCGVAVASATDEEATQVHTALEQLVAERGEGILADAEEFRAALDDYLTEATASPGTIYLLTEAIRLGALEALRGMVAAGAPPASAVESAGERLARDRGSAEPATGVWACAVLGHAVGVVPEDLVKQYDGLRSGPPPATAAPAPAPPAPPAPPAAPTLPPPAAWTRPAAPGVDLAKAASPVAPPPAPPPPLAPAPLPPLPPARTRRVGPVLLVGVLALLVMLGVGAGTTYLLTRDDDEPTDRTSATVDDTDDPPAGSGTPDPTATVTVTEDSGTTEPTSDTTVADPEASLRAAVADDQDRAAALVGSWVPQLASISDEIDGSWSEALARYEELKASYPDILLLDAAEWPHAFVQSESFSTVLVVLSPTPASPGSAPVLEWCQLNRGDRQDSCYAKLLDTSGSPRDNTDQNDPEPEYN